MEKRLVQREGGGDFGGASDDMRDFRQRTSHITAPACKNPGEVGRSCQGDDITVVIGCLVGVY